MARRPALDLSAIDGKLLDGLRFCIKVYDLFEQVRSEPDGLRKLRLQLSKREKRLIEELIPIAHYIQARYHLGNRFNVCWLSGSQPYDAIIWTPLQTVKKGALPRKMTLEVTSSRHEFAHIVRKEIQETGGSFGPKGMKIDESTGFRISTPYVYTNGEHIGDLAKQVIDRLSAKAAKPYPANTVLIINCETDGLILAEEWESAVKQVRDQRLHCSFREVFLFSPRGHHSAML